jgi:hypothetical protein
MRPMVLAHSPLRTKGLALPDEDELWEAAGAGLQLAIELRLLGDAGDTYVTL